MYEPIETFEHAGRIVKIYYDTDSGDPRLEWDVDVSDDDPCVIAWQNGEVYGYVIEDHEGNGLDSCWGFYGWDAVIEEAKDTAHYNPAPKGAQLAGLMLGLNDIPKEN